MIAAKIYSWITSHSKVLIVSLVGILLVIVGLLVFSCKNTDVHNGRTGDNVAKTEVANVPPNISADTAVTVRRKSTEHDPDLVVTQKYTASINGKKVSVPMVTSKDSTTATVTQSVDVTALVKPLLPRWEAGVGVGYDNDGFYVPVAIQRNYKPDRSLEFTIHLNPRDGMKPNGGSMIHKWHF